MATLELSRTDVAETRVSAPLIVKDLDVLKDARSSLISRAILLVPDQLDLQCPMPTLDDRVIPAVAPAAHADGDAPVTESVF